MYVYVCTPRRNHKRNSPLHSNIVIEVDFAIIALYPRIRIPSGRVGNCSVVAMRNHCCSFVRDRLPSRGCCSILHDAVALAVDGDDGVSSDQKHNPWVDSACMTKARPSSVTGPSLRKVGGVVRDVIVKIGLINVASRLANLQLIN